MTTQADIINTLNVQKQDDYQQEFTSRVEFLKDQLLTSNCTSLVLGISGGVDSLVAGLMSQRAVDELNAESQSSDYKFIAVRLPYAIQADEYYASLALDTIKPSKIEMVNIQSIIEQYELWLDDPLSSLSIDKRDFVKGNIKARTRMTVQYTLANIHNGLVVGTDHAAEAVTGFFTKFGDGACDVAPLSGLVKQTVRNIAKVLGTPAELYDKVATADLEDNKVNLPDEVALGISYADIDNFLLGKTIDPAVSEKIIARYDMTEHKRNQPIVPFTPVEIVHVDDEVPAIEKPSVSKKNQVSSMQFSVVRKELPKDIQVLIRAMEKKNESSLTDIINDEALSDSILNELSDKQKYTELQEAFILWVRNTPEFPIVINEKSNKLVTISVGEPVKLSGDIVENVNNVRAYHDIMLKHLHSVSPIIIENNIIPLFKFQ